ncbi:MAG: hypothetical protein A2383_00970 [Candidatus Pacebacteria bacterium RIFOXYB1_FULL_39_46]|nr:MAG: hypothetical protein A2182_00805 [Candidatus Pacebacteria bacterium RIFOXYA1_FULL_38_18]OGJ38153.1 MAG: hypothetical protein A2383_00970 [Candidatus Pacebacteria bacterium RIFOXYB1_FULL_39_46]OGJ39625.1 MAG: hypothetical protein A2411_02470 [Candidatus Pacebacteria bacterium RIFOXYC1_FULL_39_21]OGJ39905.1 MAG: hypothetical protein A2582_00735 [Candidatus Pacebacteria bacterium RIFOXYD1_FULL_39_27]
MEEEQSSHLQVESSVEKLDERIAELIKENKELRTEFEEFKRQVKQVLNFLIEDKIIPEGYGSSVDEM